MADDLIAWLHTQIDDDERAARAGGEAMGYDQPAFPDYRTYDDENTRRADAYLDRFKPARMLAEVGAKRLRLGVIESMLRDDPTDETARYLAHLDALPHADQPGYREEWRP